MLFRSGHVFQLGTRYSEDMKATYLDEKGQPQLMQMGCYGIGVTRILGAAIEQNFDAKGIIWPASIAPFEVVLCPMGYDRSEAVRSTTEALYAALLEGGVDVIFDDRGERPGALHGSARLSRKLEQHPHLVVADDLVPISTPHVEDAHDSVAVLQDRKSTRLNSSHT